MEISEIRPTPGQVAELDQKATDLAAVARLLGMFRKTLMDAGFSETEAAGFTARLFDWTVMRTSASDR